ncbi:MAG: DNA-processing protein DprA [Treponema sp.]|jgi:DNA processing protein|nr:DNA-processing protein DprA [Treponema sp.]
MAEKHAEMHLLDLMICRIPGLKGNERVNLVKKFCKVEDLLSLSKMAVEEILGRAIKSWDLPKIQTLANMDAGHSVKLGINVVSWRDSTYPPLLREIFDPPALLFYRGKLPDPEKPLVAVVGTRKPTSQAAERAYELSRELGDNAIPVVSGLALGIDSMAHRGNLAARAPTVAVLGSSPDNVYPSSNRDLARRILETGGLIVSEYPPGTRPLKWNFPERNRIISGLARGTVVVEAPEKSGALITARFALDQDRDLWVHKAGITPKRGAGTARLADDGAGVITSAGDILAEWNIPLNKWTENETTTSSGIAYSLAEYLDIKL